MSIFNEIKSKVALLDVVQEYTTLKRTGIHFKGLCPLHAERTPSFFVTPHKGVFYCFSCQSGGDAVAFIARIEQCSPREAVRYLAQRYNITLPESLDQEDAAPSAWSQQQRYFTLCTLITRFCHEQLKEPRHRHALQYLLNRKISHESITKFNLGYLPEGERTRKRLLGFLQSEGFMADDLLTNRFMLANKNGLYSPFEERIIFPIYNHMGQPCGFGARIFQNADDRPKYYNSHDSPFFSKSTLLFGLDHAKRSLQRARTAFVVEGYLDCIAMAQADLPNVVATLGTACTDDHIKLLARYVHTITVVYDGDRAGLEATMRLSELCWKHEIDVAVTELPPKEDPASYLSQPEASWHTLPQRDIFSFYIYTLGTRFSAQQPLAERLAALRSTLERISRIPDQLKRTIVLQQLATACSLAPHLLEKAIGTPAKQNEHGLPPSSPPADKQKTQKEINKFAKSLFCAIINEKQPLSPYDERMVSQLLPLRLKLLFEKLQLYRSQTDERPYLFSDFFSTLSSPEQGYLAEILATYESQASLPLEVLLEQCRTRIWKQQVHELQQRIQAAQSADDHELLTRLMAEFHQLKDSIFYKGAI